MRSMLQTSATTKRSVSGSYKKDRGVVEGSYSYTTWVCALDNLCVVSLTMECVRGIMGVASEKKTRGEEWRLHINVYEKRSVEYQTREESRRL